MINKSGFSTDVGNPLFTYSLYRQKRNLKILIKMPEIYDFPAKMNITHIEM